ncbi:hypothetical protein [Streptomyces roseolus]|uniref:hypothetical protein n=1 Tax=Streptomyces roseolus TaxID=67358 RepID=UPI00379E18D1
MLDPTRGEPGLACFGIPLSDPTLWPVDGNGLLDDFGKILPLPRAGFPEAVVGGVGQLGAGTFRNCRPSRQAAPACRESVLLSNSCATGRVPFWRGQHPSLCNTCASATSSVFDGGQ